VRQPAEKAQLFYELPPPPSSSGSASASGSSPFTRMPNGSFGGGLSRARITFMQQALVPAQISQLNPQRSSRDWASLRSLSKGHTCSSCS